MIKKEARYYDENNTGIMMSRITTDLFDISEFAHHGPENLFISFLKITGSFVILLRNYMLHLFLYFYMHQLLH